LTDIQESDAGTYFAVIDGSKLPDIKVNVDGEVQLNITKINMDTYIGNNSFEHNKLSEIVIPNSVTFLGSFSFSNNVLTRVEISDSVTDIRESAFAENLLTNVTIPDSVATVEGNAFAKNQLTTVHIPGSVDDIGDLAFANNKLTTINTSEGNAERLKDLLGSDYKFSETNELTFLREGLPHYDSAVEEEYTVTTGSDLSFEAISTRKYAFNNTTLAWQSLSPVAQWYKDGAPLAGQTNLTLNLTDIQESDAGTYFAVIDGSKLPDIKVNVDGEVQLNITKINMDTYVGDVDQNNATITFEIPATELVDDTYTGTITDLDASDNEIIFLIGGTEYTLSQGDSVAIRTGDKVYVAGGKGKQYQLIINVIPSEF
jgi:hypothetical protein